MRLEGIFYDGCSSDRTPVAVSRQGWQLHLEGEGLSRSYDRRQVRTTPPLGRMHRSLLFPDGAVCELAADAPLEALLNRRSGASGLLHRWERSLGWAALALLLTVVAVWALVRFGIPVLAKQAAFAFPQAHEEKLGKEAMAFLDRLLFQPSAIAEERQTEVRLLFQGLLEGQPASAYRLEFRKSDALGANAVALPSGIVVVTDGFIELAQHDEEIVGVLAHEIAHARLRHGLRQALQNSAAGLLVASLTGDITSITGLAATLPTALIDARYSRRFETEADDAAVADLRARGIPVSRYADILNRLQAAHAGRQGGKSGEPFGDLFSTHPETQERVERVLESQ